MYSVHMISVCAFVYVCACMYVCVFVCACVCVRMHMCVYTWVYACNWLIHSLRSFVYTCVYTCNCSYTRFARVLVMYSSPEYFQRYYSPAFSSGTSSGASTPAMTPVPMNMFEAMMAAQPSWACQTPPHMFSQPSFTHMQPNMYGQHTHMQPNMCAQPSYSHVQPSMCAPYSHVQPNMYPQAQHAHVPPHVYPPQSQMLGHIISLQQTTARLIEQMQQCPAPYYPTMTQIQQSATPPISNTYDDAVRAASAVLTSGSDSTDVLSRAVVAAAAALIKHNALPGQPVYTPVAVRSQTPAWISAAAEGADFSSASVMLAQYQQGSSPSPPASPADSNLAEVVAELKTPYFGPKTKHCD